jgi:hypothetical protein
MPSLRKYLCDDQKGNKKTLAVKIYEATWQWLFERRCSNLIPVSLNDSPLYYTG